jgi:hypothetical protein
MIYLIQVHTAIGIAKYKIRSRSLFKIYIRFGRE